VLTRINMRIYILASFGVLHQGRRGRLRVI
jgi:hypothetical protein